MGLESGGSFFGGEEGGYKSLPLGYIWWDLFRVEGYQKRKVNCEEGEMLKK